MSRVLYRRWRNFVCVAILTTSIGCGAEEEYSSSQDKGPEPETTPAPDNTLPETTPPDTTPPDNTPPDNTPPDVDEDPPSIGDLLEELPAERLPWTSSRALRVTSDALFAVDEHNDHLVVLDPQNGELLQRISVGDRPRHVVVGPEGTAWVSSQNAGTVSRILPGAADVELSAKVGTGPIGLALSPNADVLYVALSGDHRVVALDPETLEEKHRFDGIPGARTVVVDGTAQVVVAGVESSAMIFDENLEPVFAAELRRENPFHEMSQRFAPWGHPNTAIGGVTHPGTGHAMIAHQIAFTSDGPTSLEQASANPESLLGFESEQEDTGGYGVGGNGEIPAQPHESTISVLKGSEQDVVADLNIVWDRETNAPLTHRLILPSDINHHPTHALAAVAGKASDTVLLFDTSALDPMTTPITLIYTGAAPIAVDFSNDGQSLYVLHAHDFSVGTIALEPVLQEVASGRQRGNYPTTTETYIFGTDPLPEELREGRRTFTYAGTEGLSLMNATSCEMCHIEGTQDSMVWFTSFGPRQTPALGGRLEGTAPFNWLGSEEALIDNMIETISRMGGEGLSSEALASLQAFLMTLPAPPHPNQGRSLTPQEQLGYDLFMSAEVGCTNCHSGETLTNGFNYNVGTLDATELEFNQLRESLLPEYEWVGYNTPSLKGLHHTAPYLHDGSAATLLDVLERTATTMGRTDQLTHDEREALIAYLLTL